MLENFKSWKVPVVFIGTILIVILFFNFFHKTDEEKAKELLEKKDSVRIENIQKNNENLKSKSELLQQEKTKLVEIQELLKKTEKNLENIQWDISEINRCNSLLHKYKGTYVYPVNCTKREKIPNLLDPRQLFYTQKVSDKCYVSQSEENHYHKGAGAVLATDVACGFKAEVYSPDYLDKIMDYRVEIKKDKLLGNYAELHFLDQIVEKKWIIAHLRTRLKTGDVVRTGVRIGEQDMSGVTTGYHTHIELWEKVDGEWKNISYTTRSKVLHNSRNGIFETPKENKIYFTTYDLGDVAQNDSTPCIGASGKDLCKIAQTGIQTVALTVDMRKKLGVKFGDNIELTGNNGKKYIVQVHDEMNKRYRTSCIKNSGFCIKADIARFKGKADLPSGVYSIKKL